MARPTRRWRRGFAAAVAAGAMASLLWLPSARAADGPAQSVVVAGAASSRTGSPAAPAAATATGEQAAGAAAAATGAGAKRFGDLPLSGGDVVALALIGIGMLIVGIALPGGGRRYPYSHLADR